MYDVSNIAKIYLHSHERKKFHFQNANIEIRILSTSKTTTSIHPTSYPAIETLLITLHLIYRPSKYVCTTRTILHRRYKNSTVTVVENEEEAGKRTFIYTSDGLMEEEVLHLPRSGKEKERDTHKIGDSK